MVGTKRQEQVGRELVIIRTTRTMAGRVAIAVQRILTEDDATILVNKKGGGDGTFGIVELVMKDLESPNEENCGMLRTAQHPICMTQNVIPSGSSR